MQDKNQALKPKLQASGEGQYTKQKRVIKRKCNAISTITPSLNLLQQSSIITPKILSTAILQKYSSTPNDYNDHMIDNLIDSKNCHLIAMFKDQMIMDYIDEYFKRTYQIEESFERIPKFANYYKNYLLFFCKPIFSDFDMNDIVQLYGESKAEIYYNQHYGNNKAKKKKSALNDKLKTIFSITVKKGIDHNSKTVSSIANSNIKTKNNSFIFFENDDILNKTLLLKMSYQEESILNILNNDTSNNHGKNIQIKTQHKKSKAKELQVSNEVVSKKKFNSFNKYHSITERKQTSKEIIKEKESTNDMRKISPSQNIQGHQITAYKANKTTKSIHSRNKPIKLTTGKTFHIKTVPTNFNATSNKNILVKANYNTQSQGKLSMDFSANNNNKTSFAGKRMQSNSTKPTQHILSSPSNHLNLNDVMKLTLQLYSPSAKGSKTTKNNNTVHQHHHTISSPTINNYNININNHICLSENKNYLSPNQSNPPLHTYSNTINSQRKLQTVQEDIKKNIDINIDLKNLIKNAKTNSRNKPHILTKTRTEVMKGTSQKNHAKPKCIGNKSHKFFSSFTIFDLQQQLLNTRSIPSKNSKKSFGSRKSDELLFTINPQSPQKNTKYSSSSINNIKYTSTKTKSSISNKTNPLISHTTPKASRLIGKTSLK